MQEQTKQTSIFDISIIIVSYNVKAFLHQTILSVKKASKNKKVQLIVVDNNSLDGTQEFMEKEYPEIQLIGNKENKGFGAANNQALQFVKGKYILYLNPDTIIQEDTLDTMYSYLEEHPQVGMGGVKILNADGTLQLACRRSFPTPIVAIPKMLGLSTLFPKSRLFGKYNLTYLDPDKSYSVDAVSGSFMFCRAGLIQRLQGFDERFFMYGEDLDLCFRVKEAGYDVHYVHSTTIVHYKGESSKQATFDNILVFYKAMDIFVQKHFAKSYSIIITVLMRLGIVSHFLTRFTAKLFHFIKTPFVDGFFIFLSFIFALQIRFNDWQNWISDYRVVLGLYLAVYYITGAFLGLYSNKKYDLIRSGAALFIAGLVNGFITFFIPQIAHSRLVFLLGFTISFSILLGWRLFFRLFIQSKLTKDKDDSVAQRTLIVGSGSEGERISSILHDKPELGYLFIGFIDREFEHFNTVGKLENIADIIKLKRINTLIFTSDVFSAGDIMTAMNGIQHLPVEIKIVPENLNMIYGKTHIETFDDIPVVDMEYQIRQPMKKAVKRSFDLFLSGMLLILLFLIAYSVRLFRNYKLNNNNSNDETIPTWNSKSKEKPFLYWYPLLFKIFKGNLSFVGDMWNIPEGSKRFYKPGLFGLIHLENKREITQEEHQRFMNFYMRNYSLMMDVDILIKSIFNMQ